MKRRELLKGTIVAACPFPVAAMPFQPKEDIDAQNIDPMPETCAEALRRWDAGLSVFTVEMGGLGPGYEQCIQIMAFELVRMLLNAELETESHDLESQFDKGLSLPCVRTLGPSGAQWGAAKNLAYVVLSRGWRDGIESAPKDRHIQVSRTFPQI